MRKTSVVVLLVVLAVSLIALWGCPKKTEESAVPEAQQQAEPAPVPAEEPKAEEPKAEAAPEVKPEEKEAAAAGAEGLQPIYFDFDRSFVRDDAKSVMKANADWLKANPQAKIRVEGNCDERGTIEYNQALGQRRASSAKKYLTDLGIKANRISLISYGKEKPICSDSNEECWQKNRRDDFVVVSE